MEKPIFRASILSVGLYTSLACWLRNRETLFENFRTSALFTWTWNNFAWETDFRLCPAELDYENC